MDYWEVFESPRVIGPQDIPQWDTFMVVDLQEDFFPGGNLPVPGADQLVYLLQQFITVIYQINGLLIFTRDYHPFDHCSFIDNGGRFPRHCQEATPGANIIAPVAKLMNDLVREKGDCNQIKVMFKGFYRNIDSFGSFSYNREYALERHLCSKEKEDGGDIDLTGAFELPTINREIFDLSDLTRPIIGYNINVPPLVLDCSKGLRTSQLVITGGDLWLTGLSFDYCVLDTAITARCSGCFRNIRIIVNLSRPVDSDPKHLSLIKPYLNSFQIELVIWLVPDKKVL